MKMINIDLIDEQSFAEANVTKMHINLLEKIIMIHIDRGMIAPGVYLSKALIAITDWSFVETNILDQQTREFEIVEPSADITLDELIKINVNDGKIKLEGFGPDGWLEWLFTEAKIEVMGEYNDKLNRLYGYIK